MWGLWTMTRQTGSGASTFRQPVFVPPCRCFAYLDAERTDDEALAITKRGCHPLRSVEP
jgi:hypothetical protein